MFIVAGFSAILAMTYPLVAVATESVERIEWQKIPVEIRLVVGHEHRIQFPAAVKVGVPQTVQPLVRTQSVNGTVYLLAHEPFHSSRFMVREIESGRLVLFDVSAAKEGTAGAPIEIYFADKKRSDDKTFKAQDDPRDRQPGYIELTRFAARQLYAPSRLVEPLPGIVRVAVLPEPVDLVHGGAVEATPLIGWRANGLYVTAIKLKNRTAEPQTLDPRDLRGEWLTATFQHHRLLPKGDEADTTAVYLVSARPFELSR